MSDCLPRTYPKEPCSEWLQQHKLNKAVSLQSSCCSITLLGKLRQAVKLLYTQVLHFMEKWLRTVVRLAPRLWGLVAHALSFQFSHTNFCCKPQDCSDSFLSRCTCICRLRAIQGVEFLNSQKFIKIPTLLEFISGFLQHWVTASLGCCMLLCFHIGLWLNF